MTNTFEFDQAAALEIVGPNAPQLATKPVSELHELHAAIATAATGVQIDPKAVQIILSLHGKIQRSDANKNRETYRASYDRAARAALGKEEAPAVETEELTPRQKAARTRAANKAAKESVEA